VPVLSEQITLKKAIWLVVRVSGRGKE